MTRAPDRLSPSTAATAEPITAGRTAPPTTKPVTEPSTEPGIQPTAGMVGPAPAAGTGLAPAVRAGLDALVDLASPPAPVTDGRLERGLRAALAAHARGPQGEQDRLSSVAAATRTACAHLAAGEHEDAYLALRAAHDHLPRSRPSVS